MAVLKCKMCGGTLELKDNATTAECDYCGTLQTIPKGNNDIIQNLFNRANNLRIKSEFDKAEQIYEKILHEDDSEPEAHWGIILCKYGIEYVEDPKTYKRVPTCHRTSYEAIMADPEYLAAIEHADSIQKLVYESEARAIDDIQKNILNIVKNEKPFDVFICYKETDDDGTRTIDSTIANDIYYQLTQSGLKVFYAAITLEDKLGQEYEPYIFAALNSAKVMLVIGTKPEYYEAVWVKNEWSRFLKLMKSDRNKMLIPCYKNMDAYDLPEEFSHLQAQDMSKIGFIADIVRGIKKISSISSGATPKAVGKQSHSDGTNVNALLKRVFMFIEDSDWDSANEYCERVLDIDPENAKAYLGKLLVEYKAHDISELSDGIDSFSESKNYKKVLRFSDEETIKKLESALETATDNKQLYMSVIKENGEIMEESDDYNTVLEYIKELVSINTDSSVINNEIQNYLLRSAKKLKQLINDILGFKEIKICFEYLSELEITNPNYSETINELKVSIEEENIRKGELLEGLKNELSIAEREFLDAQNNLYNSPERGEMVKLEKENTRLKKEIDELTGFQGKRKRELQQIINENNDRISELEMKNRERFDSVSKKLPGLRNRCDYLKDQIRDMENK